MRLHRGSALLPIALLLAAGCAKVGGHVYDSQADAWKQLAAAGRRAAAGHKRVLAIVGGDW
jgi:hypothetical protein